MVEKMTEGEIITHVPRLESKNPIGQGIFRVVNGIWKELRLNWPLFLMALPALVVVFVINYMPMPGIVLAFKDYKVSKGIWGSDWVGLKNFQFLISSGTAWQLVRNTVVLN